MIKYLFSIVALFSSAPALGVDIPVILSSGALNAEFIAQFVLFVATLLLGTIVVSKLLLKLFNLPLIAGQIVGGIVFGPSILNIQNWSVFNHKLLLTDSAKLSYSFVSSDLFAFVVLVLSAGITVSYLLWLAGHETDIKDLLKVGVTATAAGILGALAPIGMVTALLYYLFDYSLVASVGLGLAFAATSVSIPVALFFAKKKLHLRTSKVTLGAAIVDDVFAMLLLSFFMIAIQAGVFGKAVLVGGHSVSLMQACFKLITCFAAMFIFGYYVSPKIMNWLQKTKRIFLIAPFAFILMAYYFAFAELYGGLAGITGAYFAGLFHRTTDIKNRAIKTLSPFVNAILLPLFLGSIGLQVDFKILQGAEWVIVMALLIVAIISKLIGTFMATEISNLIGGRKGTGKWSLLEGFIFGSSMVARGEVGLVISTVLKGGEIITPNQYVISVVVIILTTIVAPIMLTIGFNYEENAKDDVYTFELGHFKHIGTMSMFHVVISIIEKDKHLGTAVNFSEDNKIVSLEEQGVVIIYDPVRGIVFKGDHAVIDQIMDMVKEAVASDYDKLAGGH